MNNKMNNQEYLEEDRLYNSEPKKQDNNLKMDNSKLIILIISITVLIIAIISVIVSSLSDKENKKEKETQEIISEKEKIKSEYRLRGNYLQEFDLSFLKLENKENNMVYSPLSIKYTLEMLNEGANGKTKEQIEAILGDYNANKYVNSPNMSFANAIYIFVQPSL